MLIKRISYLIIFLLLININIGYAKSFSSSSSSRSSFSSSSRSTPSSSSRSFSSSSTKPSSIKSFSSGSTKSSPTIIKSTTTPRYVSSGKTFNTGNIKNTIKVKTYVKPNVKYVPSNYGSYSRNYYNTHYDSGFNSNGLMFYMIVDSLSDAAVMTALANKDDFNNWKTEALSQNNTELNERIKILEDKLNTMNATNIDPNYVDPEIESKLKEGLSNSTILTENNETSNDENEIIFGMLGAVAIIFLACILMVKLV